MSAEVAIALGVAGRVFVNAACAQNPRLGAALVGVFDGFLIHRSWLANTFFEPLTLIVLAAGLFFDHYQYGGFEGTVTLLLGCGLGVVLADFGPDLWYEIGAEQLTKDVSRELEAMFSFGGDDSVSDVDDRSDAGSVVSASTKASASTHRTARSAATGTSVTVRPARPRPQLPSRPASSITRFSRVTFDESSISQSQGSDNASDDFGTDAGLETQYGLGTNALTSEFALEPDAASVSAPPSVTATGMDGLYMEPSTSAGSIHTRVRSRPSSILRRLDIPVPGPGPMSMPTPRSALSGSTSTQRSVDDGETTPRAAEFSPEFTFAHEAPTPPFPEPDASYMQPYLQPLPPSRPISVASHAPIAFPEPAHTAEVHEPSRLSRILNFPIVDPHEPHVPDEEPESPESARLWAPSVTKSIRSRSSSPAGPRPQPSSRGAPTPPPPFTDNTFGEQMSISDSINDSTVDVRDLDRETTIECIEEAWKVVEKKRHRRLNILVNHDDEGPQTKKSSNFHLLEDLENLRFNMKVRPGLIVVTSRSRP
ncbi:hypothetical protein M0805_005701 [Coniferiporia weirii]|nr:hypothetical protein M0805_005701 [Coniferiporia weirii]